MSDTLYNSICHIFYIMIPASIGLIVLAEPIIETIFIWNDDNYNNSIQHIYRALIFYAPGLIIFSIAKLIIPIFYSLKDMRTPVRISLQVVIINVILNILSIIVLPDFWKHAGLAISTVIAEGMGIYFLIKKLNGKIPSISKKLIINKFLSVIWRSILMGIFVIFIYKILYTEFYSTEKIHRLIVTLTSIVSGIIFYLILSIKQKEQLIITNILHKRIKNDSSN